MTDTAMIEALSQHWPEYVIEAGLLGFFMVSACAFGALLSHPDSPLTRWIQSAWLRRGLMGIAMGSTAVALIYSPWGQQSGAHMNPATTLTFFLCGKVAGWDALLYVIAQFVGGVVGVVLAASALGRLLRHTSVNYVVTAPGKFGTGIAWLAELAIAFGMMLTVLFVSNHPTLTPFTGLCAGALVALYITLEAPLSGMSLNPARSFGSALIAGHWRAIWVYFTAPIAGMLLASAAYSATPGHAHVYCAKLNHCNNRRCIFRCEFAALEAQREARLAMDHNTAR